MKTLQVGCIGCGFIGDIHLRNALKMPGVHIRGVADVRQQAARAFHERFQTEYWTTDSTQLAKDPALDAVLICTFHASHAELATACARAGKHVFLEKPMGTSSAECVQVIRACESAGVKLALDLKFRFATAVLDVKRAIPEPFLIVSQTSMEEIPETSFDMDPHLGGGIVETLGAHSLDLPCFLAGSEPIGVYAQGSRLQHRKKARFDVVTGTLEFASGCLASFLISDCAEWSYPSKWFFEVADGRRSAVIHNHCRMAVLGGELSGTVDQSDVPAHEVGSFGALQDFIEAIRADRPPKVGGKDGLRFAMIAESLFESIRHGKRVEVMSPEGSTPWYRCEYV
jgi:predicted dehydrogenase